MLLEIKNLQTHFFTNQGVVKAVDGISYNVKEGEIVAIVGESGSGKSVSALSLIKLIPQPLGKIVAGEVIFEGRDLMKLTSEELRGIRGKSLAIVFQEPMTSLNPVLPVGKQISEILELHQEMTKKGALREAIRLLQMVGIPDPEKRIKAYPHEFSGGQRQRVMIAMAISCRPKVLIADEPTTALDVTIQAQLLELISKLVEELGTSVILITHNLGVVARFAKRVNVMYAGRIVECGTAKEIYREPLHPYTRALIASVPRLDQKLSEKLKPIGGEVPTLINLPQGCSFHPRCPMVEKKCQIKDPGLLEITNDHSVACWVNS